MDVFTQSLELYNQHIYFLKKYPNYDDSYLVDWEGIHYDFDSPILERLKYINFNRKTGTEIIGTIKEVLFYLRWVNEKLLYKNSLEWNINHYHAADILKIASTEKKSVNCLCHCIVLTELLLLKGYYARTVKCLPMGTFPFDNHCLTEVFIPSIGRWILLDPTYNFYCTDNEENFLSIADLRKCYIENKRVIAQSNNRFISEETVKFQEKYLQYMAKNMFRFQIDKNVLGKKDKEFFQEIYELCPLDYLPSEEVRKVKKLGNIHIYYITNDKLFWQ